MIPLFVNAELYPDMIPVIPIFSLEKVVQFVLGIMSQMFPENQELYPESEVESYHVSVFTNV